MFIGSAGNGRDEKKKCLIPIKPLDPSRVRPNAYGRTYRKGGGGKLCLGK
jgi:hypothetical protein